MDGHIQFIGGPWDGQIIAESTPPHLRYKVPVANTKPLRFDRPIEDMPASIPLFNAVYELVKLHDGRFRYVLSNDTEWHGWLKENEGTIKNVCRVEAFGGYELLLISEPGASVIVCSEMDISINKGAFQLSMPKERETEAHVVIEVRKHA